MKFDLNFLTFNLSFPILFLIPLHITSNYLYL
nr:MAG TPA: hypothetical protein [Caudoviricetes sp.]